MIVKCEFLFSFFYYFNFKIEFACDCYSGCQVRYICILGVGKKKL